MLARSDMILSIRTCCFRSLRYDTMRFKASSHIPTCFPSTVNKLLRSIVFIPEQLKISKAKPLFKKGDSSLFSNYRPISLLPSISKIFEYVIFKQLITYLNTNNPLCPQQLASGLLTQLN